MTQMTLFDCGRIARACDRETSQEAAREVEPKLSGLRAEFVARLRQIGHPATAQEIAAGNESLRKRAAECVRLGFVDEFDTMVCSVTGKRAVAYWLPVKHKTPSHRG